MQVFATVLQGGVSFQMQNFGKWVGLQNILLDSELSLKNGTLMLHCTLFIPVGPSCLGPDL